MPACKTRKIALIARPNRRAMEKAMKYLKALCGVGFFVVLVSNVWSISGWNEIRGVYDDICYLRQAHLFQKFGLGGLDTNVARDDDHYLSEKLKAIGFPTWSDVTTAPCHTLMPATNKLVMQYPPGTGFVLALFPSGFQVIPLYVLTSAVAFGFALVATVVRVHRSFSPSRGGVRRRSNLPDDQSDQGELFDGADDDGLRAGGFSDREALC